MKHIIFPTSAQADAFIADLQGRGLAHSELGQAIFNRRTEINPAEINPAQPYGEAAAEDAGAGAVKGSGVGALMGAAAGILGAGAVVASGGLALPVILGMTALGAGVGGAVGAVGGAMGVDENRDGLTGHDASSDRYRDGYSAAIDDEYYDELDSTVRGGGRVVAVDDSVPSAALSEAVNRHGGRISGMVAGTAAAVGTAAGGLVDGIDHRIDRAGDAVERGFDRSVNAVDRSLDRAGDVVRDATHDAGVAARNTASAAGDVAQAAGNKIEEGADRLRAVGHEIAGAVTGNPKHDALAAEDRAKADMNNAQAHRDINDADRKV